MTIRAALASGTLASLAAVSLWSYSSTLTEGPASPLHMTRDLPGDYAQLATAATGSSWVALLAVTAAIYAACLLTSGLRARKAA